jgi:thiamine biosynthesis protein ThiI
MHFVIKLFPEISLKSQSIQRRFTTALQNNVGNILLRFDPAALVQREYDKLIVSSTNDSPDNRTRYLAALTQIPGIQTILEVQVSPFVDQDDILAQTMAVWGHQLAGKTFCVRVRRNGHHPFTSVQLQRFVGAGLFKQCPNGGVRMREPDVLVQLEVDHRTLYLVQAAHPGLGGYPLGTQEQVLSLLSGGFDSAVASYQFIKRGCRVHYCLFNLGGAAHQRGVQQMAWTLWHQFGSTHRVRFLAVDFAPVLADIVQHIPLGNQGVVLKRMMLRVADQLAQRLDIPALVTGEALGQVASQTLSNLQVIDRASQTVVLRPLVTWDKPDIIAQARRIGVATLAETIPEYCGSISKNPTIKANLRQVEKDELLLNEGLLKQALEQAEWLDVRDFAPRADDVQALPLATAAHAAHQSGAAPLQPGDVVIDVRSPAEVEEKPLHLPHNPVQCIPFYKIASTFAHLDRGKTYFLYCERGVMSQLQALHLQERGFTNVRMYR